jgi:sulfoxide reductase heme-binding subunit YedZ
MELDIPFALEETLDKPFIYLGMIPFLLLLFMTITSTKKLFKKYNKYHKVLYIMLGLTTIHFVMAQKSLSMEQYFYLGVILVILVFKFKKYFWKKKR